MQDAKGVLETGTDATESHLQDINQDVRIKSSTVVENEGTAQRTYTFYQKNLLASWLETTMNTYNWLCCCRGMSENSQYVLLKTPLR